MFLKKHLSGDCIVYDDPKRSDKRLVFEKPLGRPQGSLYGQQKRKISDACEYLRLSLKGNKERCALIFTLTSPYAACKIADEPKFISSWFKNMRNNYGMGEYVWTREYTKTGSTHFHCVADWHYPSYFYSECIDSRISVLSTVSLLWSRPFKSDSLTSCWLGTEWKGKRHYYLNSSAMSRYISKYIGKDFYQDPYVSPQSFQPGTMLLRSAPTARLELLQ